MPSKDSRAYQTLTGFIGKALMDLVNLMNQHSQAHQGKYLAYSKRISRISKAWNKLPYPHEVDDNNSSFI